MPTALRKERKSVKDKRHGKNASKLTSNGRKEGQFWSQKPSKDEIESWVHDFSNGLLQFDEKKIKLVLRMTKESTVTKFSIKIDHELPRTPESDIWRCISPYHQPCDSRKSLILPRKSPNKFSLVTKLARRNTARALPPGGL